MAGGLDIARVEDACTQACADLPPLGADHGLVGQRIAVKLCAGSCQGRLGVSAGQIQGGECFLSAGCPGALDGCDLVGMENPLGGVADASGILGVTLSGDDGGIIGRSSQGIVGVLGAT